MSEFEQSLPFPICSSVAIALSFLFTFYVSKLVLSCNTGDLHRGSDQVNASDCFLILTSNKKSSYYLIYTVSSVNPQLRQNVRNGIVQFNLTRVFCNRTLLIGQGL